MEAVLTAKSLIQVMWLIHRFLDGDGRMDAIGHKEVYYGTDTDVRYGVYGRSGNMINT